MARHVVWIGGDYELKTCPVLLFDPEIERALDWFGWIYELTEHGWRRRDLPDASRGGVAQQDARLMLLLEAIAAEANTITADRLRDERRQQEIAAWRAERAKAARQ